MTEEWYGEISSIFPLFFMEIFSFPTQFYSMGNWKNNRTFHQITCIFFQLLRKINSLSNQFTSFYQTGPKWFRRNQYRTHWLSGSPGHCRLQPLAPALRSPRFLLFLGKRNSAAKHDFRVDCSWEAETFAGVSDSNAGRAGLVLSSSPLFSGSWCLSVGGICFLLEVSLSASAASLCIVILSTIWELFNGQNQKFKGVFDWITWKGQNLQIQ